MKKALRLNEGKVPLEYVLTFPEALAAVSRVCQHGEFKYERLNYKKSGKPTSEYVNSLLRHLLAWHRGEDLDSESKQNHLGHVLWNALALTEFVLDGTAIDDRPHVILEADGKGEDKA